MHSVRRGSGKALLPLPTIRPETVRDYAAIADLHARAFGNRSHEPIIVTLLRQRAAFDPELSLVAERDGRIVGHVLFSPHTIRLLAHPVRAVNLAPIAVEPAQQGQGIGGALIEEGHRMARARGYAISFLLGHSSYYPRFGYRTRAYGWSTVTVATETLTAEPLEGQAPRPDDIAQLDALWRQAESEVDFSIDPGPDLLDWISPNPAIQALVYRRDGEVVGYTRIHRLEPAEPRIFLARGGEAGQAMAGDIARRAGPGMQTLTLPIHPAAASAGSFADATIAAWEAAMAVPLAGSSLQDYLELVARGQRPPGMVVWPVAFDLG
ncbi:MAG: N-acetyltransferase [Chloroflexota bacterium]|nr:N-acetyltransferase [Chloroflexota bacterium]